MPNSPIALNNLGYFLVERGSQLDEAVDLIKKALRIDPKNQSYIDSLGWAYFSFGKLDAGGIAFKRASRLDIESASIQEHPGHYTFVKVTRWPPAPFGTGIAIDRKSY